MVNKNLPKYACDTGFKEINIENFNHYQICKCGEHINNKTNGMTIRDDGHGYKETNFSNTKVKITKKFKIHELIAKTYIPNYNSELHYIIHIDENTTNNKLENLKYEEIEIKIEEPIIKAIFKTIVAPINMPELKSIVKNYEISECGKYVRSIKNDTIRYLKFYERYDNYLEVRLLDYKKILINLYWFIN